MEKQVVGGYLATQRFQATLLEGWEAYLRGESWEQIQTTMHMLGSAPGKPISPETLREMELFIALKAAGEV